jgi:hypothetical protein
MKLLSAIISVALISVINCQGFSPNQEQLACFVDILTTNAEIASEITQNCGDLQMTDINTQCTNESCSGLLGDVWGRCGFNFVTSMFYMFKMSPMVTNTCTCM